MFGGLVIFGERRKRYKEVGTIKRSEQQSKGHRRGGRRGSSVAQEHTEMIAFLMLTRRELRAGKRLKKQRQTKKYAASKRTTVVFLTCPTFNLWPDYVFIFVVSLLSKKGN